VPDVRLVPLERPALHALLDRDLPAASRAAGVPIPEAFLQDEQLWRWRAQALERDPGVTPWLPRAIVIGPGGAVVGHAGFHGPPDERGMVEIGYSILPEHRRRGYARAAVQALLAFAREHGARVIRASVSPGNEPSLAIIRSFGFVQRGEQMDEIDGRELVFERPA
jgi:ribosomal-protein-alanine N-acetyltransferase